MTDPLCISTVFRPVARLVAAGLALAVPMLALPVVGWAAEQRPFAAPQVTELPASGAGSFVQVTVALAIVLGAVFAAAWLMQRMRSLSGASSAQLKVVASVALGTKERAVLIQVGRQQLLVGVAAGSVKTLHVLDEPVAGLDSGSGRVPPPVSPEAPTFKSLLRKGLGLSQ